MRVKEKDLNLIKSTIKDHIDDAKIYLFGSMLNDAKKGGDIDLFIITKKNVSYDTIAKIRYILEENLLRPIDLIFHKDFNRYIEKEALKGVEI